MHGVRSKTTQRQPIDRDAEARRSNRQSNHHRHLRIEQMRVQELSEDVETYFTRVNHRVNHQLFT